MKNEMNNMDLKKIGKKNLAKPNYFIAIRYLSSVNVIHFCFYCRFIIIQNYQLKNALKLLNLTIKLVSTLRALRSDCGRHYRPTQQTILNRVNKCEEVGSVTDTASS